MNNNVYGKTMENLRERINVRFDNNVKVYFDYVSKPTFLSQKIFNEDFPAIHEIKPVLLLNKPINVEYTVLELSKYLIYDFNYNFIKKKADANLLLTDIDNLIYETKPIGVYEEVLKYKHLFVFSEYK